MPCTLCGTWDPFSSQPENNEPAQCRRSDLGQAVRKSFRKSKRTPDRHGSIHFSNYGEGRNLRSLGPQI